MGTLICTLCKTEKVITEFYKNNGMFSGYANQCKECVKARSKKREFKLRKNTEWVEKEKMRAREKYHRLNYKELYKPCKEYKRKIMNQHKEKYPEKVKAKNATVNIYIPGFEKHHWSYNKEHYKDYIKLKTKDHAKLHRYMIYDQERSMYRCSVSVNSFVAGQLLDKKYSHIKYFHTIKNFD